MTHNLFAYTPVGMSWPGYVSINRLPNGDVEVTVRGKPTVREGAFVCGNPRDRDKPGRCTPGDLKCNNYCNMAPGKGPMQPHPLPCTYVDAGPTVSFVVPAAEWPTAWERPA